MMIKMVACNGLYILVTIFCLGILTDAHVHKHDDENRRVEGIISADNVDGVNHFDVDVDIDAPPRRKLITRYEDVATELRKDIRSANGGGATHFDIEVSLTPEGDNATQGGGKNAIMLHLTKLPSTITIDTDFLFHPGRAFEQDMVNDLAILASDPDAGVHDDDANDDGGTFAILSVNLKSGDTRGIQRKKGGQILQLSSTPHSHNESSASSATTSSPLHGRRMVQQSDRKFTCGVDHAHSTPHGHGSSSSSATTPVKTTFLRSATIPQAQAMTTSLASDTSTFVINLVVAIDTDFLNLQGGTGPAVEYINWLISATNAILEPEVGARLKVVKIKETDIFNSANSLDDGLNAMRKHFSGTIGANKNLVHALLGRHIGGGIAYVDTVCDSDWGYGLSSGIQGSMSKLDADAFQDAFMVAHEIGHSLGSGHTFDGYDPPVDTCGVTCPSRLPLDDSATLMSYCNFCDGGLNNIAMTYGGKWNGVGPKFDIDSWNANPNLVSSSVSKDARRVSRRIWETLASTGQCIVASPKPAAPAAPAPTPMLTVQPTNSKPTKVPSQLPISSKPTKAPSPPPTPKPTDLPSAVPTSSKRPTKAPTFFSEPPEDGRIWYQPNAHCMESSDCATAPGVMFDMVLLEKPSSNGVLIESLLFRHIRSNATVDIYSIRGSSLGIDQVSRPWTKVASVTVNPSNSFTIIDFDFSVTMSPGGKRGFYLTNRESDNIFIVGPSGSLALPSYDINGVAMQDGSVRFGTFGVKVPGYNPIIQAGYSMALQPKTTANLTTTSLVLTPKMVDTYTIGPDYLCKDDCFVAPGFMFNVRNANAATSEISITSISFEHLAAQQQRSVDLYRTFKNSYSGNEQNPSKWVKIATTDVPLKNFNTIEYVLDQPITLARGEMVAFYIKAEENILLVRQKLEDENPTANNVQLLYGSSIMNGSFGIPVSGYSWNGAVTFTSAN